jgi:hypothetical protein
LPLSAHAGRFAGMLSGVRTNLRVFSAPESTSRGEGMADQAAFNVADEGVAVGDHEAHRILETYLTHLHAIHASGAGVPETSYYPALSNLFDAVGKTLKPRVRCIITLSNQGAGLPDGGLYTADQFQRPSDGTPKSGQPPARGAIEVKGTKPAVKTIAASEQVRDYLARYRLVLVTNLREFLIVEAGLMGEIIEREGFSLAAGEEDFWQHKAAHPRATATSVGDQFVEFIRRACLHAAPLNNPKDVAWFLASYARDALFRVQRQKELPALLAVRRALEEALGMKFTADKGEHFFRSTLVQTLFYGVFSAWVRWHKDHPGPGAKFDWRTAEWSLHVPFIRTLYEEVAKPSRLGPLGLVEVLDWSAAVLNRVERGKFFQSFEDEHAVPYFYEPFLEAFDPELRKELGVWYTPQEIVKYQVARVDTVLREELNLPDGLADPRVIVLDLCCGTATYLVEVLRKIGETLRSKGGDALVASDLKQAAMNRVFGFEIMPAPFVVSHLQLGLLLQTQGAPLSNEKQERVGVYLTNALTGWEPPKEPKTYLWPELAQERDAAQDVKCGKKILVVLGNPPYNAFAGISPEEEQGLVEPYKERLNKPVSEGGWGIRKFNLDDLYVRFFRLAERRIAQMSGQGVVSFISNFSYLSDPSFVVMRQRFLAEFDKLWFDCLNGDSRETGKLTPDDKPDPSVFSTDYNREGIRVGTAICVMVRKPTRQKKPVVRFRHFWGVRKRIDLLESLRARRLDAKYANAAPRAENRHSFRPEVVSPQYDRWPTLPALSAVAAFNGPVERRGNSLIRFASHAAEFEALKKYLDPSVPDAKIQEVEPRFMLSSGEFHASTTRVCLLKAKTKFDVANLVRYPFKPFDTRIAYLDAVLQPLFSRPSPQLLKQRFEGNTYLISRDTADKTPEGPPFYHSRLVCDYDAISGHARHFPILLMNGHRLEKENEATLFAAIGDKPAPDEPVANLSSTARAYMAGLKFRNVDDPVTARLIWMHALAIGYSPAYLQENADGIRRDWPRIPLPANRKALKASAAIGEHLAALLDTETEVGGVTAPKIAPLFRIVGTITKIGGGAIDPASNELTLTAGWGIYQPKAGAVMPAAGKVLERPYDADEAKALDAQAAAAGLSPTDIRRLLGETTLDIYLNPTAYWANVPRNVWQFYIGGYQVLKKWLSYREYAILRRPLHPDEAREVTSIARRLAAIILLQPALDANYQAVKAAAFPWQPASPNPIP